MTRLRMQSARLAAGALVLLLGVVSALFAGFLGGSAEAVIHVALGASFVLIALSTFDFPLPRWIRWLAGVAIGAEGLIFLLQAAGELIRAPTLTHLAYDVLGQHLEKVLGYVFLLWCALLLAMATRGWTRIVGAVVLTIVVAVELYSFSLTSAGGEAAGALKLFYLPIFAWLLLEGLKRRPATSP